MDVVYSIAKVNVEFVTVMFRFHVQERGGLPAFNGKFTLPYSLRVSRNIVVINVGHSQYFDGHERATMAR